MSAGRQYVQSNASGHSRNHYGDVHGNTTYNETHNHYHNAANDPSSVKSALFLTDPRIDRATIVTSKGERVAGTCLWILEEAAFVAWQNGESHTLWISGGPGRGKTMLAVFLTERFERLVQSDNATRVLYYFCDHQDRRRNNAISMLRSILWLFVALEPGIAAGCAEYFDSTERTQSTLESVETLWWIFEATLSASTAEEIILVLDGLDECDGPSVTLLSAKFAMISKRQHSKLRAIIVSRDIVRLRRLPRIRLDPEKGTHLVKDIEIFIASRLEDLWHLDGFNDKLKHQLHELLRDKAAGTFLWVGYAMIELLQKPTCSEVLEAAQKLPAGLPTFYNRMLMAIHEKHRSTAARIFKWIALAVRPLSLLELATVACVAPQSGLSLEQSARDLLAACGPMIAIKEKLPDRERFETSADATTVGFVHSSVKEYLRGLNVTDENALADFKIIEDMAELELVHTCIQCLQDSGLHRSPGLESVEQYYQSLRPLPLLDYSTVNWYRHAAAVSEHEQKIWRSYDFFLPESVVRQNWSWVASQPLVKASPLTVAAYLGVLPWANHILTHCSKEAVLHQKHDIDVTTRPDCQTPFVFAILGKQFGLVRLLLDNGAAVNKPDDAGNYPLHIACGERHFDITIVRELIDHGADVNASNDSGETALDIVLDQQERVPGAFTFLEVIQLLKAHGAIAKSREKESLEEQAERRGRWEEIWPESGPDRRTSSHSPASSSGSYSPRFWAGARTPRRASSISDLASPLEDREDVWLSRRASLGAWQRRPDRRLSSRSPVSRQRSRSPRVEAPADDLAFLRGDQEDELEIASFIYFVESAKDLLGPLREKEMPYAINLTPYRAGTSAHAILDDAMTSSTDSSSTTVAKSQRLRRHSSSRLTRIPEISRTVRTIEDCA